MKKESVFRRIIICAAVLTQIIICAAVFSYYKDEYTLHDFKSDALITDSIFLEDFLGSHENGYYIDSSEEAKGNFLNTPPVDLKVGLYKVVFHYQSGEQANSYFLTSDNADFREWVGNYHRNLPTDKQMYTTNIWLSRTMKNFEAQFDFNGDGYLFVSQVEIIENRNWVIGAGILLFIIFLCMDAGYFFRNAIKKKVANPEWKNRTLILTSIILFTSLPLFNYYLIEGHDLYFHLLRIEGIKEGLQSGQFPVKLQPNWLNGYGYGPSFFYGDILLYFPAALRIFGMGIQSAYKCFILFINILTAVIAYYSFKRLFHDEKIGLFGCMLYTTSIYRMNCIYVRAAVGEYCALMFLPLILVAVYEILWLDESEENLQNSWLIGAIGVSGLIMTHIISTEITAVLVVIICLIYWKKTFRKNAILQFLKMGLGTLVAALWFLVPFIDMFRGKYNFNSKYNIGYIQTHGTFLGQLFNIFPYAEGEALSYTVVNGEAAGNELCYSIGGGLIAGILLFMIYSINYGKNKSRQIVLGRLLLITGGIIMIMTTAYFPWNDLQNLNGTLKFMISNIQFPWRLLGLSTILFTTLALLTITAYAKEEKKKGIYAFSIILLFAIISSGYFEGRLINDNNTIYLQNTDDISTETLLGKEYLPINARIDAALNSNQPISSEGVLLESIERKYQKFNILASNLTEGEGCIDLPLLYYDGYVAENADLKEKLSVVKNSSGFVRVILPEQFSGEIIVNYIERWYWRLAEIISLIGIAGFIVYRLSKTIKREA